MSPPIISPSLLVISPPPRNARPDRAYIFRTVTEISFEGASFCLDDTYKLVSTEINFKDFIENNYMEVYGNVEKMIQYSGMSEHNFNRRFREEYGMPPKAWMTERFKKDILRYASLPNATTSFVASKLYITDVRLCQLTRKYYDLTPQQLIEMRGCPVGAGHDGDLK